MQQPLLPGLQRAVAPPGPERRAWSRVLGLGTLALAMLSSQLASAQTTKTLPGDYASFQAAFTDLNTNGVPAGGVTINVAAGYTETAANLLLTATGSAASPIVFQKAGTGTNPTITAAAGTAANTATTSLDAIIKLRGSDYVTFDGLTLVDPAANTADARMEFGVALYRTSNTDGCQYVTIRNCAITLQRGNTGTGAATSIGIFSAASTDQATAVLSATGATAAGQNSNNKFYGNTIQNVNTGIYLLGLADATPFANFDQGNDVGGTSAATGNSITSYGGTTGTTAYGVRVNYQNGLNDSYNTIGNAANSGVAGVSTLYGIYHQGGSTNTSYTATGNSISLSQAGNASSVYGLRSDVAGTGSATVTNNTFAYTAATGNSSTMYGFYTASDLTGLTLTGNRLDNTGNTVASSGSLYFLYASNAIPTYTVSNNTFTNFTKSVAGGTVYGYYNFGSPTTGTATVTGNTISNITLTGATGFEGIDHRTGTGQHLVLTGNTLSNITAGSSTAYGLYTGYGDATSVVSTNTIAGLSAGGTVYGINVTSGSTLTIEQNVISGVSTSGASSAYGLYLTSGTTNNVLRNKIYNLSGTVAGSTVYGLYTAGGTTNTIVNNLIGNLTAPAATGSNAVVGIYLASGANNVYFNSLYLNASSSSATTFGTSGIYVSSTTPTVDLRNNIVVNTSTPGATGGATAALRYTSAPTATFATTSNNNLYYAGTPGATRLIYVEGTTTLANAKQTLTDYKAYLPTRDQNAVTENPPFISTTGTDATFLHLNTTTPTQAESAGTAISSVTVDFDGQTRSSTPDIGADEGTFQLLDATGPIITLTALANTPSTANRTLTVTITDPSGIATGTSGPRLFFRKGTSGAFQSVAATTVSGSSYNFTFDYSLVGGVVPTDAIQYYVVAQDASANGNVSSIPVGGSFTTAPAQVYQYLIQTQLSGIYYVGTGTSPDATRTFPTLTAATTSYNNNQLTGAVTFVLLDASYGPSETFPIQILNNADASATNTLTIKPNTGLTTALTGSNASALLQLIGSDYVTLDGSNGGTISATDLRPSRNWTISNTSTATTSNGIVVTVFTSGGDAATNNTFKNLVITGSGTATAQAGIIMLSTGTNTVGNNNNVVRNNAISSSIYGVYSSGPSATVKNTGTVISQNDLNVTGTGAIGRFGITALFEDGVQITQNNVDGINFAGTGDVWGISAGFAGISASTFTGSEVLNATIDRNYVGTVKQTGTYSAVGIALASAASGTTTISNNMVAGVSSNGTSGDFGAGIYVGGGTGSTTRVLFNSVSMTGTQTSGNYPGFALAVGGTTAPTVEIRNNVLVNTQTTGTGNSVALGLAYSSTTGAYVGLTSSNNDFLVGTGTGFAVGQTGALSTSGVLRATLAAFNTETGQDNPTTSKVADPSFVSATNLHSTSTALNNAGVPVAGITVDFDGQSRSATTPDIGADEFTLSDLATTALAGPTAGNGCYSATEAITVTIRNNATVALDFAATPATVTVTVTGGAATQTITTTVNTGTLAAGASQDVAVGTVDLSAAATYSLTASVTVTGDENAANNALATPLTIVSTPRTVAFTYPAGTICAGSGSAVPPTLALGSAAGGTFSAPAGLTIDPATGVITPSSSAAGTYVVTYSVAVSGSCPALTANQSVTVTPVASAAFSYAAASFCASGTNPTPTVTGTAGGTFSSTSGLSIDATTGAINLASSSPGTYIVTYNSGGACPSSATASVTITAAPVAAFSYAAGPYCAGATSTITPTLGSGATAGTFSSTAGLSINATTGVINVASSTQGTYTVTNTVAASGACAGVTATATVTITPATTATFAYSGSTFCLSGTNPTPTITGTAGGTFSSTTGLSLNATTGAITLASSTPGTYTVTYSVGGSCPSSGTASVTITAAPSAAFSYATATYCAGSTATVAPAFGTGSSAGSFSVSPATGLTINATTGVITLSSSTAGTYTVTNTIAASGGCATATATATVTITAAPVATLTAGGPTTFCQGGSVVLSAPTATGNTYQYLLNGTAITGATAATYSATASGSYSVTVTNAGGCSATSTATAVTVNPTPTTPTLTLTVLANGAVQLTSSAATGNQFYRNNVLIPGATGQTYLLLSSAQNGTYTVVTTGTGGCASAVSNALTIVVTASGNTSLAGVSSLLYPNPSQDGHVTLELRGYAKATQLTVLNSLGQVVRTATLHPEKSAGGVSTLPVDMSALPAGMYWLRLSSPDTGMQTLKLVRE